MSVEEVAWVAGLLEGEGSFMVQKKGSLCVSCSMTDEDVVRKLHELTGMGSVITDKLRIGRRQVYTWRIANRSKVVELITYLRPYMGSRRGGRIDEMLAYNFDNPKIRQENGAVSCGTRTKYSKYDCRCDRCKTAEREYNSARRKRKDA